MDIYQNDSTGIFTAQDRPCNVFGVLNLGIDFSLQMLTYQIYLWEIAQDALDGKTSNNIRIIQFGITTEETLEDCIATLFAGSPYDLGEETLNLSDPVVIGQYPTP